MVVRRENGIHIPGCRACRPGEPGYIIIYRISINS